MRGVHLSDGELTVRDDLPPPAPAVGEVRVRVVAAGVCATDLVLLRGSPLADASPAFDRASAGGTLKVLIDVG